jgi:RNA polymerase sigma-70 factor (ECF subfamily)
VEAVYRAESRRVLATLIRLLGDFDAAEEAMHEAFVAAVEQWPREGVPVRPRAWLISAGRFKAIDALRRRARFDASLADLALRLEHTAASPADWNGDAVEDDRLRLMFTCCHPALTPDAQVALTLREVCGLTTEQIAHAFLTAPRTVAQRIVRAKGKIRDAGIPYQVPARDELRARLDPLLHVVYLVFNQGHSASSGETLTRPAARGLAAGAGGDGAPRSDAAPGIAPCGADVQHRRAGSLALVAERIAAQHGLHHTMRVVAPPATTRKTA